MKNQKQSISVSTPRLTAEAMLCALGVLLMILIRIPIIPTASFLIYDPADIPIIIGALAFGIAPGLIMTVVVSFLQAFVFPVNGTDGPGFIMHVIATGLMVIVIGLITKKHRNLSRVIIALIAGILAMTIGMCLMNLIVTPIVMGISVEEVWALIPIAIIPFNLLKGTINSVVAIWVYQALRKILPNLFGDR